MATNQKYNKNLIHLVTLCVVASTPQHAQAKRTYSTNNLGFLGLNTTPSARMDNVGTLRTGTSISDPYINGYIGVQIAEPLYVSLRQTAETSNIKQDADRLYPGVDLKLRLIKEKAHTPEIALGLQSAIGHKRMAGEYLALSKRYKNFDFTAGLGWGRFGTANHFKNPLRAISSHFNHERDFNSEHPNEPQDWFTGKSVGLFGGVEYFLPWNGLSLKLDYGADRYSAEKAAFNFNAPAPWSAGISYTPKEWLNAGIAIQGTNRIMARLSLQGTPEKWPFTHKKYTEAKPFYKERKKTGNTTTITQSAANDGIDITDIYTENKRIHAQLNLPEYGNTPQEIGRAIRHIASNSPPEIEEITITLSQKNLHSETLSIMRSDVEKAMSNHSKSSNEIWKNTEFITNNTPPILPTALLPTKGIKHERTLTLTLENTLGLSEEDHGALYRSSFIVETKASPFLGFLSGTALRLNIKDNLNKLEDFRTLTSFPVRSDIAEFTKQRASLEHAYLGYAHSFTPDLHILGLSGYLEEFHAGIGGEILYRPFDKRLALGAEIWNVTRRQGNTPLNLTMRTDNGRVTTGHINAWYDIPHHDITVNARAGRFLGTDWGASAGLQKEFKNGATLKSTISISNAADSDVFGGTTHANHNISLTLPLGSTPLIPTGSSIKTTLSPFGRNAAQSLNKPIDLLSMTEGFTVDHIAKYWDKVLD